MTRKPQGRNSYAVSVAVFALLTRLAVIVIQVVVNNVLPDHRAGSFHLDPVVNPSTADKIVHFIFDGFSKWDASYFLHIAQSGYQQPNLFAFFPLYPSFVRILTDTVVVPVQRLLMLNMNLYSCVLLAAVTANVCFFCSAAVLLYHLGVRVLSSQSLAYKAALLFCINPASVFMTAAYTESLFASLSFGGMLALECDRPFCSAVLFTLSGATRSNGFISVGFLVYYAMKRTSALWVDVKFQQHKSLLRRFPYGHLKEFAGIASTLPLFVLVSLPFILFQVYTFMIICTDERNWASFLTTKVPVSDHVQSWCYKAFPLPYAEIQSQYWNVGFLRYYKLKQWPNFLLALPMVVLCADATAKYCNARWRYVRVLGLARTGSVELERARKRAGRAGPGVFGNKSFVYVVHLAALVVFGVTCMHVQVVTRFVASSCPVVFWHAAYLTTDEAKETSQSPRSRCDPRRNTPALRGNNSLHDLGHNELVVQLTTWAEQNLKTRLVLGYFAGYYLVGIAMHCNFLPWT